MFFLFFLKRYERQFLPLFSVNHRRHELRFLLPLMYPKASQLFVWTSEQASKRVKRRRKLKECVITLENNWTLNLRSTYRKISHFISNCSSSRCVSVTRLRNSLTVSQRIRTDAMTIWKSSVSIIDCFALRKKGFKGSKSFTYFFRRIERQNRINWTLDNHLQMPHCVVFELW